MARSGAEGYGCRRAKRRPHLRRLVACSRAVQSRARRELERCRCRVRQGARRRGRPDDRSSHLDHGRRRWRVVRSRSRRSTCLFRPNNVLYVRTVDPYRCGLSCQMGKRSCQRCETGRASRVGATPGFEIFYLGQGRGQVVLYEQPTQHAIFIPLSLVALLQTSNCETHRSPDKICRDVKK